MTTNDIVERLKAAIAGDGRPDDKLFANAITEIETLRADMHTITQRYNASLEHRQTEIERLRAKYRTIRTYADHKYGCPIVTGRMKPCDCGYDELLVAGEPT